MPSYAYFSINVLPVWDRYLHEFTKDIRNMHTDTLMHMANNPYVRGELIRRGALPDDSPAVEDHMEPDEEDFAAECVGSYNDAADDDDFVPFGEDDKLPKSLRKWDY